MLLQPQTNLGLRDLEGRTALDYLEAGRDLEGRTALDYLEAGARGVEVGQILSNGQVHFCQTMKIFLNMTNSLRRIKHFHRTVHQSRIRRKVLKIKPIPRATHLYVFKHLKKNLHRIP